MTLTEGETQLDHLQESPGTGKEGSADWLVTLLKKSRQSGVVRAIASTISAIGEPRMRRDKPQAEPRPQAITAPESLPAGSDVPNAGHGALAWTMS